jgi:DNA-binding response OmpR family regulator/S1-C subfamily serine protease
VAFARSGNANLLIGAFDFLVFFLAIIKGRHNPHCPSSTLLVNCAPSRQLHSPLQHASQEDSLASPLMDTTRETIIALETDPATRDSLVTALTEAGFNASAFTTSHEVIEAVHQSSAELVLLDASILNQAAREILTAIRSSAASATVRAIFLVGPQPDERSAALDFGADDAISRPWDHAELLSRIRAQLRAQNVERELRRKMRIAEETQQFTNTAFEALAVTEKMSKDAFSLDRSLKVGFVSVFVVAAIMAAVYFLFAHNAQTKATQANKIILQLEGNLINQQDLIAEVRKLRATQTPDATAGTSKVELQQQANDLKSKMATAGGDDLGTLQKELADTNARLKRVEQQGDAAQSLIPANVESVCLLHVAVAFADQKSGQRLHYAGLNPQSEPLKDSSGNPIIELGGPGPEVRMDVFGTGFLAGPGGRVITNRHVAEPWWKNDDISAITSQGVQAQISSIRAYFPGDPRAFSAEIQTISKDADLASIAVDMQNLKRPVLSIDAQKNAAQPGQSIVLMGYTTGLAALLARTDEDTAQQIITRGGNDISEVLDELAHRGLIRPIITQGHIGDVLPDKIVFDAQTTSGGSGGPLINQQGEVVGVTVAVLKGFGGSNFGIPIRLSQPLLVP